MSKRLFALLSAVVTASGIVATACLTYFAPANWKAWCLVVEAVTGCAITCMGYFVKEEK